MAKKTGSKRAEGTGKADYEVGYGRPPKHGQIKPGEVRNRHGRNGRPRMQEDLFGKAMGKPTRVTIDGESVWMSTEEALYMRTMAMALGGHIGAIRVIEKRLALREGLRPAAPTPEELEKEAAELEQRKELSARLVRLLDEEASRKKAQAPRVRPGAPKNKDTEEGEEPA